MAPTAAVNGTVPIDHSVYEMHSEDNKSKTSSSRTFSLPHVVAMVGLPGRGKTFIAQRISRYFNWSGFKTKVFSVGGYRRKVLEHYDGHDFFSPDNKKAMAVRLKCNLDAIDDLLEWLNNGGGDIAVLDATNATIERRSILHDFVVKRMGFKLLFVEVVCDDSSVVEANIMDILKDSPDYKDMKKEAALDDFLQRIEHYVNLYVPLGKVKEEDHLSYIKTYNAGESVSVHRAEGYLQGKLVSFLTNLRPVTKTIYISRHGESEYNMKGKIGGDADLSHRGKQYANCLAKYFNEQNIPNLKVWTSQFKRTAQTAQGILAPQERVPMLNEINAGICEGFSYEEIQEQHPEEFARRDQDKYRYRYPNGESYEDVCIRLEPVLLELEQQGNILIVSHQATLRCLLSYFLNKDPVDLPYTKVPLHTIMKLTEKAHGCKIEYIKVPVECVDTFREKPRNCSTCRTDSDALISVPLHY